MNENVKLTDKALLHKLEYRYGVRGWAAVHLRQKLERNAKRKEQSRVQVAKAFAQSGPRLVRKTDRPIDILEIYSYHLAMDTRARVKPTKHYPVSVEEWPFIPNQEEE